MRIIILAIALLIPSIASAQWIPPRVPPTTQLTYQVPFSAIRFWPRVMIHHGWRYQPQQAMPQGHWQFVPTQPQQPSPQQRPTPQQKVIR